MWITALSRLANFTPRDDGSPLKHAQRGPHLPGLLALTSDERLYYMLLSASIDLGWKIAWARTATRAFELWRARPMPLVVCDERLPDARWRDALVQISGFPDHPAVLLASAEVNEELWRDVLRHHAYDAVRRSAGSEEWKRELRFAWLSKSHDGNLIASL